MGAKHQFIRIRIPKAYGPTERLAIAQEAIDLIRKRTDKGLDKDGSPFPGYSQAYKKSLDFKIAGKSSKVNLYLSGDMLTALGILSESPGEIKIGYESGSEENGKADGNIRGTYGRERGSSAKARPFLGISPEERQKILDAFPLDERKESRLEAEKIVRVGKAAKDFTGSR